MCAYLDESGKKCAVGALMSQSLLEEIAFSDQNAHSPESLALTYDEAQQLIVDVGNQFLRSLQSLHDDNNPADWLEALLDFAHYWDLNAEAISNE